MEGVKEDVKLVAVRDKKVEWLVAASPERGIFISVCVCVQVQVMGAEVTKTSTCRARIEVSGVKVSEAPVSVSVDLRGKVCWCVCVYVSKRVAQTHSVKGQGPAVTVIAAPVSRRRLELGLIRSASVGQGCWQAKGTLSKKYFSILFYIVFPSQRPAKAVITFLPCFITSELLKFRTADDDDSNITIKKKPYINIADQTCITPRMSTLQETELLSRPQ